MPPPFQRKAPPTAKHNYTGLTLAAAGLNLPRMAGSQWAADIFRSAG